MKDFDIAPIVTVYASVCLALIVALAATARRFGRARVAPWLVVIGIFMLTVEEPLLTLWFGLATPAGDRDGMLGLVTPQARAHVLDAAVLATGLFALLGWIALGPFRRGERWARRALAAGASVAAICLAATTALVYARGLALPTPGGAAPGPGFGWQPLVVGLLGWLLGLWIGRGVRPREGAGA
jgi:hypothetical protein